MADDIVEGAGVPTPPDKSLYIQQQIYTRTTGHRAKWNYVLEAKGEYPSLFLKMVMSPDEIEDLEGEGQRLKALETTGVTPKFVFYAQHKDGNGADLYMTAEKGISPEDKEFATATSARRLPDILRSMLHAMSTIHEAGYIWRDINEGSFLVDVPEEGEIKVHIVDAELARRIDALQDEDTHMRARNWYLQHDEGVGIAAAKGELPRITADIARLSEYHLIVLALVIGYLGVQDHSDWTEIKDQMSPVDIAKYDKQLENIKPSLQRVATAIATSGLKNFQIPYYGWAEDSLQAKNWLANEERRLLEGYIERAMLNITLPYLLKETGLSINIQSPAVKFMQQMLSPFLQERPKDLSLLSA